MVWNTVGEDVKLDRFYGRVRVYYPSAGYESNREKRLTCVNPLTWSVRGEMAGSERNLGGVRHGDGPEAPIPDVGVAGAQCVDGLLRIEELTKRAYKRGLGRFDDYHLMDYPLFYINIRRNAEQRANAFL